MITAKEKSQFLDQGYLHVSGVLDPGLLAQVQEGFDKVWETAPGKKCNQHVLLTHPLFISLIEHSPILKRHQAIFGQQTQLLQYDFLRQGPRSSSPVRAWHRDFVFPGDTPLSINTILYLDDMTEERGPTYVLPGSHRGSALPAAERPGEPGNGKLSDPLAHEVAVHARPGDAVFINSAIWHSGGCNNTDGLRRAIYLYYGYWWLKRYESEQSLPWQALENASEQRLQLLGVKMPGPDLHMYNPTSTT